MDRRDSLTIGAAAVGAAALTRVEAQAQAAPGKIRVGYSMTW
jgi:hypothetical protein